MKACYASDEDFVQLLLRSGADPGVANNRGNTAVDIAKATGASDAVRRLLETTLGTRVCD
jgi:ankyrin repeat protein